MTTADWVLLGIVAPVIVALILGLAKLVGRLFHYMAKLTADAVVDTIGETLRVRWEASIMNTLGDLPTRLDRIEAELKLNGGGTVKDRVMKMGHQLTELQQQVEEVLTSEPPRRRKEPTDDR